MNAHAHIGHNGAPDPIDEALAPFAEAIDLAENTLIGIEVNSEAQMKSVDALTKQIKAAKKAVEAAEESEAKPIYEAWKAKKAEFKPTLDDLDRLTKGLVAMVDGFKRKLAAEKAEKERLAREEAARLQAEAQAKFAAAAVTDIDAQREAEEAAKAAKKAIYEVRAAAKDTVKGMRSVTRYEVTDHRALLNWIARNDRDAITRFIEQWAAQNHKTQHGVEGLNVWTEKEAF